MRTTKDPVRIRTRELKNGTQSLYLDINVKGKRTQEFLGKYIITAREGASRSEKAEIAKANASAMKFAEAVRARRLVEIDNNTLGIQSRRDNVHFSKIFDFINNAGLRKTLINKFRRYAKNFDEILFKDVDEDFIEGFVEYMKSIPLKGTTINIYTTAIGSAYRSAFKNHHFPENNALIIPKIKCSTKDREYLTIDELRIVAKTKCRNEEIKRAFLFSCLCGIRYCDISLLKWSMVSEFDGFTRLTFTQKKTKEKVYLDINKQAAELLGERGDDESLVFNMSSKDTTNKWVKILIKNAGINKHISFHCARHTFATMMLTLGNDLFVTSKLLGHKDISTTQIYAKIVDKKRQEAVSSIPDIL